MSPDPPLPAPAARARAATDVPGPEGTATLANGHAGQRQGRGKTSTLEEYANALETQLAVKSALLDEVVSLHQRLEARMLKLEQGVSWKDRQLQEAARHGSETWARATEELAAATRQRDAWRGEAERLREDNLVLNDALLERSDVLGGCSAEISRLEQLVEVQQQAQQLQEVQHAQLLAEARQQAAQANWQADRLDLGAAFVHEADPQKLSQQLARQVRENEELRQKQVLLEEQLRLRAGADPASRGWGELEAAPELAALPFADVWGAVGRGAADRICGASPHLPGMPLIAVASIALDAAGRRINAATGGTLLDSWEEEEEKERKVRALSQALDQEPREAVQWRLSGTLQEHAANGSANVEASESPRRTPRTWAAAAGASGGAGAPAADGQIIVATAGKAATQPPKEVPPSSPQAPKLQPTEAIPPLEVPSIAAAPVPWLRQYSTPDAMPHRGTFAGPSTWSTPAAEVQMMLSTQSVTSYPSGDFDSMTVSKVCSVQTQALPNAMQQGARVRIEEAFNSAAAASGAQVATASPPRTLVSAVPGRWLSTRGVPPGGIPSQGLLSPGASMKTVYRAGPPPSAAVAAGVPPSPAPSGPPGGRGPPPASPGVTLPQHPITWRAA